MKIFDCLSYSILRFRSYRVLAGATVFLLVGLWISVSVEAQKTSGNKTPSKKSSTKKAKAPAPFRWVNPLPKGRWPDGLKHATFKSPSMKTDVGYCIYLPPGYDNPKRSGKRYPVVYYLHGGRPGNETKSIRLARLIDQAMEKGDVPEMIYVFVNGGKVSHYNTPQFNSFGEDVFVKELIPHIDSHYRTLADREHRGIEGFSQGGRGTTRVMFRHPDLFYSCAPGGSGYATEQKISENNGRENDNLTFAKGDNAWDLARAYAQSPKPPIRILVHVGSEGSNYQNNLAYMKFLKTLNLPFERLVVEGVPHSAYQIYQQQGVDLMNFHAANFGLETTAKKR